MYDCNCCLLANECCNKSTDRCTYQSTTCYASATGTEDVCAEVTNGMSEVEVGLVESVIVEPGTIAEVTPATIVAVIKLLRFIMLSVFRFIFLCFLNLLQRYGKMRGKNKELSLIGRGGEKTDKAYNLDFAVPGITKEMASVQLTEDGNLMVKIENKQEDGKKAEDGKRWLRREFSYTSYSQAFTLPDDVERETIKASVNNGILSVELPKKAAEALPASRQIEIQ